MRLRLDKWLTATGLSRARARGAVLTGRASVDGAVVRDPGFIVPDCATVTLDGVSAAAPGHLHLLLHKPAGVLTARSDTREKTVFDLLAPADCPKALCAVGRLDKDVTGVLLLTTDGELAHRLISPRRAVAKVYRARVSGELTDASMRAMTGGLDLGDFRAKPADLRILAPDLGDLTVTEGKYHQVKRMFEKIGCPVISLTRVSVCGVALDPNLAPGQYRRLTAEEAATLYEQTDLEVP